LQEDYLNKMQIFVSDKTVIKLMKESHLDRKPNSGKAEPRKKNRPSRNNSDGNLIFTKKNSIYFNFEINKINFKNSTKFLTNEKDLIKNSEFNYYRGFNLIEDSLKNQRNQFLEKLRLKIYQQNLKSDSKLNSRHQSFIKRKTINTEFNSHSPNRIKNKIEGDTDPIRKLDLEIQNTTVSEFVLTKPKKKLSLFKKEKKHVGTVIEDYLNKLHVLFYNNTFEGSMKQTINILNEAYEKKKQNFEEYIDQKIEVEMMIDENPNYLVKKSYAQLLNTLRLENERDLIDINFKTNSKLNNLIDEWSQVEISEEDKIEKLNEGFIDELVEVFK